LSYPRIAIVGFSRQKGHFSRVVAEEFVQHQYDVVPVNPKAEEIDGRRCYPSVTQIDPPPHCALIMTAAKDSAAVVDQCAQAGIAQVWLYRSVSAGSVSPEAIAACQRHGLNAVIGECPLMWLPHPKAAAVHHFHKKLRGFFGRLPK